MHSEEHSPASLLTANPFEGESIAGVSDDKVVTYYQVGQEFSSSFIYIGSPDTVICFKVTSHEYALPGTKTEKTVKVVDKCNKFSDFWAVCSF